MQEELKSLKTALNYESAAFVLGTGVSAAIVGEKVFLPPDMQSEEYRKLYRGAVMTWSGFLIALLQELKLFLGWEVDVEKQIERVTEQIDKEVTPSVKERLERELTEWKKVDHVNQLQSLLANGQGTTAAVMYLEELLQKFNQMSRQVDVSHGAPAYPAASTYSLCLQQIAQSVLQRLEANQDAPLAKAFRAFEDAAIFTTNYDTLIEKCLGRLPMDFDTQLWRVHPYDPKLGEYGKRAPSVNALDYCCAGHNHKLVRTSFVVHLHGLYHTEHQFVLSDKQYKASASAFTEFMLPLAVERSLVFVGAKGTLFDEHFVALWKALEATGRRRRVAKHFVLIRAAEAKKLGDDLRGLGQWVSAHLVLVQYPEHSDLPALLEGLAQR